MVLTIEHRLVFILMLAAFILRLAGIAPLHAAGYTADEKEYISLATKLASGERFQDSNGDYSTKAPLFPLLLSWLMRVFGSGLLMPHLLHATLGAMIVLLGYHLSRTATADAPQALVTAGIVALYPGLVVYSGVLQTETLYIVFVLLSFVLWEKMRKVISPMEALGMGVAAALAALTRAVVVGFFPLMLLLLLWLERKAWKKMVPAVGVALAAWCIVLAPWTVRNANVHNAFVPVSSWGGVSLLLGNNPYATGTWSTRPGFEEWLERSAEQKGVRLDELSETSRSAFMAELAVSFIADHPGDAAALAAKKLYMFWIYPIANSDSDTMQQALCVLGDIILYALTIVGVVACAKKGTALWVTAIAFFTLVHVAMHVEARYRLPLVPLIALFAGNGGALLMDTERRQDFFQNEKHRVAVGVGWAALGLVYAYTAWQFFSGNI
ncbi:MAG: hypothetical protein C4326_00835 [Ignavibacteria bacterium]